MAAIHIILDADRALRDRELPWDPGDCVAIELRIAARQAKATHQGKGAVYLAGKMPDGKTCVMHTTLALLKVAVDAIAARESMETEKGGGG